MSFKEALKEQSPVFSSNLCSRCRELQEYLNQDYGHEGSSQPSHIFVFRQSELKTGSCGICRVLYLVVEHENLTDPNALWTSYARLRQDSDTDYKVTTGQGAYVKLFGGDLIRIWCFELCSDPNLPCPWSVFPCAGQDSKLWFRQPYMTEDSTLRIVSTWLEECSEGHSGCFMKFDTPLPTRVLAIGGTNNDIRLLETGKTIGRYACLSHCWGEYQAFKTTKSNIDDQKPSIPWNKLPKIFQDAILIVRGLGCQYIWIDSLCIIQDDKKDWVRESRDMCDVYQNSYITIAASSAANAAAGLFPQDQNRLRISGTTSNGAILGYTMFAEYDHPDYYKIRDNYWPLLRRAWVY